MLGCFRPFSSGCGIVAGWTGPVASKISCPLLLISFDSLRFLKFVSQIYCRIEVVLVLAGGQDLPGLGGVTVVLLHCKSRLQSLPPALMT